MKVRVVARPPNEVPGDVVVQIFEPERGRRRLPLAAFLHPNARNLISSEPGATTWLESRRMKAPRVLMVALGNDTGSSGWCGAVNDRELNALRRVGRRGIGALVERAVDGLALGRVVLAPPEGDVDIADVLEGMLLRAHAPLEFLPDHVGTSVEQIVVCCEGRARARIKTRVAEAVALCDATNETRNLSDLPSNIGTPSEIASRVRKAGARVGLKVRTINNAQAQRLGMGLLLGVSAGSKQGANVVVVEHNHTRAKQLPTLVLIGKGVTIDTGGYNLKQGAAMPEQTYDKAGAVAVIGAMQAIATLGVEVHVVALVPLVENLVGASAYRPGDILKAMDGTSVFVESTDAEGRLALADCLTYAKRYKPSLVVDIATLTAASGNALGWPFAALFTNDDAARKLLVVAGEQSGEFVWPMPIHQEHADELVHPRAILRNLGSRSGGACSAAAFLRHFTDYPWAHIDMGEKGATSFERPEIGEGATGFGTRLLIRFAQAFAREHGRSPASPEYLT